jgi:hypothetical protein
VAAVPGLQRPLEEESGKGDPGIKKKDGKLTVTLVPTEEVMVVSEEPLASWNLELRI